MDIDDKCSFDTTNINSDKLKEIITKNREKLIVSFIGRVSTGKSSIINTILGINLLPVSGGQTTKYSIYISGIIDNIFQVKEGDKDWETFISIDEVKDYLLKNQNENISNIEINLPINIYKILEKCTFIDNPAIGYSDELDKYVLNQYYRSCYLYVLVIDAVASISLLEKKFLSELNKKEQILEIKVLLNFTDCIKEAELPIALTHHNRSIKEFFYKSDEMFIFSGYAFTQNKAAVTNEKQNSNDSENVSTVNGNLFDQNMFINNSKVIQFIQTIPNNEEIEQIYERIKYLKIKKEEKYQNVNIHHSRKSSQDNLAEVHNTHEVISTNTNKQETKHSEKTNALRKKVIANGIVFRNTKEKSDQNHRKSSLPNDEKSKKDKKFKRRTTHL